MSAILQLCFDKNYQDCIDNFFVEKLNISYKNSNGNAANMSFKFQEKRWNRVNKEKFFFISVICRLRNTTSWLFDNNIIEHNNKTDRSIGRPVLFGREDIYFID